MQRFTSFAHRGAKIVYGGRGSCKAPVGQTGREQVYTVQRGAGCLMQSREIREASEVRTQGSISSHLGEEEKEGGRQEEKVQRKGDVFFFFVIILSGVIHDEVCLCLARVLI